MSQSRKIKILDTSYNKETNLVKWHIEFLDNLSEEKKFTLAWIGDDLGKALGIKGTIPPDMMEDFCISMRGKELNLVMDSDIKLQNAGEFKNMGTSELQNLHNIVDRYPYYEVLKELEDEQK